MRTRIVHLINPQTDQFTTRPMYMGRALYSPLAGLLAVAAVIPQDRYEVVMTDEHRGHRLRPEGSTWSASRR